VRSSTSKKKRSFRGNSACVCCVCGGNSACMCGVCGGNSVCMCGGDEVQYSE
jgi:hypothetical protein